MSTGALGILNGLISTQQVTSAILGGTGVTVDDSIVVTERVQNAIRSFEDPNEERGLNKEQFVALQKRRIGAEMKFSKQIAAGCLLICVPAVPVIAGLFSLSPVVAGSLSMIGGAIFVYEGMPESNHRMKEAAHSIANRARKISGHAPKDYGADEEDRDLSLGVASLLLNKFPALSRRMDAIESKPLRYLAKAAALPYIVAAYPYKKLDDSLKTRQVKNKAYSILDFNVVLLSEIILSALIHSGATGIAPLMLLGGIGAAAAVGLVMTAGHIIAPLDNWGKILETSENRVARLIGKGIDNFVVPTVNFFLKNAGTLLLLSIGAHMLLGPVMPALTTAIGTTGALAPCLGTALTFAETAIGGVFAGYALGAGLNGTQAVLSKTYAAARSLTIRAKPGDNISGPPAAPMAKPAPAPAPKAAPPVAAEFEKKAEGAQEKPKTPEPPKEPPKPPRPGSGSSSGPAPV